VPDSTGQSHRISAGSEAGRIEMAELFTDNLLRMIGAVLYQILLHQTAREMFGKSYPSLGVAEKLSLEQTVFQLVALSYQAITPESLRSQQQHKPQVGFQSEPEQKPQ
jgi:hypothetical protein